MLSPKGEYRRPLAASVYGITAAYNFHNTGYIGVVRTYSDPNYTINEQTLVWGTLVPDSFDNLTVYYNQTIYMENYGGQNVNVSLSVGNWQPADAYEYVSVTWDHQYALLTPGLKEPAVVTLALYPNATNSDIPTNGFSFDITINESW